MAELSDNLRGSPELLNVTFRHITYTRPGKGGKQKEILHDISGHLLNGRLTAILGPSGAGKTSLLHVLSGFKTKGVKGSVLVNGVARELDEFRAQSCYITQEHALLDRLTTLETLMVAAKLKLTTSHSDLSRVVSDIIDLLGLSKSRDTFVQYLSGGEKKRLSIGLELITNPPIMFFDEPTSGLDSVSSAQIMYHLRSLASSGRTIACVIHQPNSRLCSLFDDVILLAEGQILYYGPISKMVPVFEEAGFPYPEFYSRADFALEIACQERGQDLSKLVQKFQVLSEDDNDNEDERLQTEDRNGSKPNEIVIVPIKNTGSTVLRKFVTNHKERRRKYPIGQALQFWILLQRTMMCTYRDLHMCQIRFGSHILIGLLLGVIFYDIGDDAAKINSNAACLFFFVMFLFFSNAMPTTLTFPLEMRVFLREHLNNWYSLPPYFFAKCIANIPLQLMCPIGFFLAAYWITGQPDVWWRVGLSLLPCVLLVVTAQGLSMSIGAACGLDLGIFMVPVISIPMLLFSGFFQRLQDIPYYIKWLSYMSPFKNTFEAIAIAVYGMNRPKMDCSEPFCFFRQGDKFLAHLGMHDENYWSDIIYLSLWALLTHALVFLVVKWRVHISK